ncbi:hypothetical protein CFP56_039676 [Quercus suber]|uniref:Uncharacterized protein n=1 Tax=Quercus suber TaxID=58331 RepID=A0AAW0M9R3_QUESU
MSMFINEFRKGFKDINKVHNEFRKVFYLFPHFFYGHPDLLDEFTTFIPEAASVSAKNIDL